MYILNYWHSVADYGEWKKVFDRDPLGREASGVRRYVIEHPVGEEHMVIGHLEFDSLAEAETFSGRLQEVWDGLGGQVVSNTGQNITEVLEQRQFGSEAGRRAA